MKTLLLLSLLVCAALAAPAGEDQKPPETVVEVLQEDSAPKPENSEKEAVPETQFNFCPNYWQQHESLCYRFINIPKTWYQAEEYCNQFGAHVASVRDQFQYNFLQGMALNANQPNAWLGGFYLQDRWMWIDSQRYVYSNWHSQSTPSTYPCMYLQSSYGWRNTQCTSSLAFICVKNPFGC